MRNSCKSLPSLANSPTANADIMQTLRELTEYKIAVGQLARQVRGMDNYDDARKAWNTGLADLAVKLDPLKAAREAQGGQGAAGAPAAAGAGGALAGTAVDAWRCHQRSSLQGRRPTAIKTVGEKVVSDNG